jgi:hypothetical protein
MNVYDFDGTIYHPDCAVSFAFWCLRRHPSLLFTYVPKLSNLYPKPKQIEFKSTFIDILSNKVMNNLMVISMMKSLSDTVVTTTHHLRMLKTSLHQHGVVDISSCR